GRLVVCVVAVNGLLGGSLMAVALAATVLLQWGTGLAFALVGLTGYTALLVVSSALEVVFRAQRQLGTVMAATILEKATLLGLVGVALAAGVGIAGIAAGYVAAGLLRVLFDLMMILRRRLVRLSRPRLDVMRRLTSHGLPFALNRGVVTAIPRLDVFLLATLSTTAAGYFAIGDR